MRLVRALKITASAEACVSKACVSRSGVSERETQASVGERRSHHGGPAAEHRTGSASRDPEHALDDAAPPARPDLADPQRDGPEGPALLRAAGRLVQRPRR